MPTVLSRFQTVLPTCSISNPPEFGGGGLPFTMAKIVGEMVCGASVAFELVPGLTQDCFEAILHAGTEEQKQMYCGKLANGEWTGTMCLTEPQAGTDLASIKTKAIPQADGTYKLEGDKIFITGGEHSMVPNIIHFVLARMQDSPAGVKGLSTFIVPKFMVNADGSVGERNGVQCVGIEHKMGMHGSGTCSLRFEGATGFLIGAPNTGIQNMFVMMNLARIMVGYQGLGLAELATQNAIRYAMERKQGKALNGGDTIIHHPDVRRMILEMKATTEGARVLALETAIYVDIANQHPDAAVRQEAQDWVDLNTPMVKSYCTDAAFEMGSMAVQVYGGHGFIRDHGVEQIVRDAKILALYEGTNGVQAMDLVRRKLMLNDGRLGNRFFIKVRAELAATGDELSYISAPLLTALNDLEATTKWLQETYKSQPQEGAFGCVDFLKAFSLTYLGYNWLRMAKAAAALGDAGYRDAKIATARYFATRMLTKVPGLCATVRMPIDGLMSLDAEALAG
jgi:alkylation response protein AidB-like acyl-CoA dehydrogenase